MLHRTADELPIQTFSWGTLRWVCNGELLPGTTQTVGVCEMFARQSNPTHYHPNCEEILYVQQGRGRHRLGDEWVTVEPGSVVRIPVGMLHQLVNESDETMVTIICFNSADRQTVFLE